MKIAVRRVDPDAVVLLRHRVLRPGMAESTARLEGDLDPETIHLAAVREVERAEDVPIVGVATFLVRPHPDDPTKARAWQLRGMAVDPSVQGLGIGSKILAYAVDLLAPELLPPRSNEPGRALWCKARENAVAFYRRNGWVVEGERFDIPPFGPHFMMRWQPDETRSV